MKVHNKIIYLLTSIFIIYTLLFSGFIYYSISKYAFADFYKRLEIRAAVTAKIRLESPSDVRTIQEVNNTYLEELPNQTEYILPVENDKIKPGTDLSIFPVGLTETLLKDGEGHKNIGNLLFAGIRYESADNKEYLVVISAENYFYTHHIVYLRNLLFTSLAYAVLLIFLVSLLMSRTLIRPVNSIIKEVEKIGSKNLHLRLKVPKKNDILSKLTVTFNDMLIRLETSFETQKNFISNASHELNTPLTSIIGEADLALSRDRDIEAYKAALRIILEEAEKLEKKTTALLHLAQTGFNGKSQKFERIRIDQLIMDVQQTVSKVRTTSPLNIDFSLLPENSEKLIVNGNEQLLHLALFNLIVNAFKYSDGKIVNVALGATDSNVFVIIQDKGIGIPENEMKYIYDPYYRASNTANYEGHGIGLPLSRNIILMHKGELIVNSQVNKGTIVQIILPVIH